MSSSREYLKNQSRHFSSLLGTPFFFSASRHFGLSSVHTEGGPNHRAKDERNGKNIAASVSLCPSSAPLRCPPAFHTRAYHKRGESDEKLFFCFFTSSFVSYRLLYLFVFFHVPTTNPLALRDSRRPQPQRTTPPKARISNASMPSLRLHFTRSRSAWRVANGSAMKHSER